MGAGRRTPALAAIALAALALAIVDDGPRSPRPATTPPATAADCSPPLRGVVSRGPAGVRAVALTFDDGPSEQTAKVLRALRRRDARATFFPLGREIPGREGLLRRAVRDGNELGNHSTTHTELPTAADIEATSRLIERATGRRPCLFRPPGGRVSDQLVRTARRLGMTTVTWDVDPADWAVHDPRVLREHVRDAAAPASIVLMHDGGGDRAATARSISALIDDLRASGYELVTVSELLRGGTAVEPAS